MASPTPRIVELASEISTAVNELQSRLSAQGVPTPSFAEDNPVSFPADVTQLRDAVLEATNELHELLLEPLMLIFRFAGISNMVGIDALSRFRIPEMIPPGGQISYEEISDRSGLDKALVRRLVRHAMTMRILREPEPGMVAHTKASKLMAAPNVTDWAAFESRDIWPATTRVVDAIQKWPSSEEPNQTGFSLANNTDKPVPEVIGSDMERMMRFGSAMKVVDRVPGFAPELISRAYDWKSLGSTSLVHIGGSRGQIAVELAKNFPGLKVFVQDEAMVIEGAEAGVPDDLKGRVEFMKHGLFEPQTVQADVYLLRMVLRGMADKYSVPILKALIPALRPGTKILIQEACMPEPNTVPTSTERFHRAVDISLKTLTNGRTRYLEEWRALLAAADERFVLHKTIPLEESVLMMLEVYWDVPSTSA